MSFHFFLGTHQPHWLWDHPETSFFVSDTTLRGRKSFGRAGKPWACDSGGFTELTRNGRWTVPARTYAERVHRYDDEIGSLLWAAPQDWMCEPIIREKTGLSVAAHQYRTLASVFELRDLGCPVIPVLQGWEEDDYRRHVDMYSAMGVDLAAEPVVGIGSICRRQNVLPVLDLIRELSEAGLRLHAFGFKKTGLKSVWHELASSDSLAWSYAARRSPLLPECEGGSHKNCANCFRFATKWESKLREDVGFENACHS